jgi:hypothetical protein
MDDDERTRNDLEGYQEHATQPTGVPSATVPGALVEPHGGHRNSVERSDGTYVDGNVDERGVDADGVRQSEIAEGSLDEQAGADTSPRTDGRGHGNPAADAAVPDDTHPGSQH